MCSLVRSELLRERKETDEKLVGTWSYDSKVSRQPERLPVAASLMGAAGLDYELITFARKFLENCDLPNAVGTGRDMFRPDGPKREKKLDPPAYGFQRPKSVSYAKKRCLQ